MEIGWKCPECGRVNAPHVNFCGGQHNAPINPANPLDCGCPIGSPCFNTACPRALKVTCRSTGGVALSDNLARGEGWGG